MKAKRSNFADELLYNEELSRKLLNDLQNNKLKPTKLVIGDKVYIVRKAKR